MIRPSGQPQILRVLLLLSVFVGVAACGDDFGVVEGTWLRVEDCGGDDDGARVFEPFRLKMDIFGLGRGQGPLYVRGQDAGPATVANSFVILVEDEDDFRAWRTANPGAEAAFGGDGAPVRGSLVLAATCPDSYQTLEAEGGRILFAKLGHDPSDRVEIQMLDFSILDRRSGEIVGTGFSGEMSFEVRGGHPYEVFPP